MFFKGIETSKVLEIHNYYVGSTFSAIGIPTSPILFEIPAVESPDPDTDSDWVQMTSGGVSWQLDADNLSLTVAGAQLQMRVKRANTTDNLSWKW